MRKQAAPIDVDVKALLHAHSLRVTTPRIIVLATLLGGQGHMSAEEIFEKVLLQAPTINLVTIYRTLESFAAAGLVARVELGDKVTRWEWVGTVHHHLVCRHCGAVVDLDDAPFQHLTEELQRVYGVVADARHVALPGLCAHCAPMSEGGTGILREKRARSERRAGSGIEREAGRDKAAT